MKKLLLLLMLFCLCGCDKSDTTTTTAVVNTSNFRSPAQVMRAEDELGMDRTYTYISFSGYGVVKVRLFKTVAPITVDNFIKLANSEFYNGLYVHRVIDDFMVQGGNPEYNVTGRESTESIKGEFMANGFSTNDLYHKFGVISMARVTDDLNSAASQFFIVENSDGASHLDGYYAGFGVLVEGGEVIHNIANCATDTIDGIENVPIADIKIESVTIEVIPASQWKTAS